MRIDMHKLYNILELLCFDASLSFTQTCRRSNKQNNEIFTLLYFVSLPEMLFQMLMKFGSSGLKA
jgi:hypothetical protein